MLYMVGKKTPKTPKQVLKATSAITRQFTLISCHQLGKIIRKNASVLLVSLQL